MIVGRSTDTCENDTSFNDFIVDNTLLYLKMLTFHFVVSPR